MTHYCGNPGRSGHAMSMKTGEKVYEARKQVAKLFHIENPGRLLFTKNTTESLNLAMYGFLQEGDHVITTSMEHNSVLRPLKALEERGVQHSIVCGNIEGCVSAEDMEKAITEKTRLIVMTAASNVTGSIMPIKEVSEIARRRGIPLLLDAAQGAGSMALDVEDLGISMMAFPGHKGLLGPLGTGCLYVSEDIQLKPLLYGGTGTESRSRLQPADFPEGFEAGTVNAPGIIGLGYAASAVEQVGIGAISYHERQLISRFDSAIRNMNCVDLYGPVPEGKTGISLFNIRGIECEEVADRLNREFGIAVRSGYHCAGLAHRTIGTFDIGAVRLSVGPFNTGKDIKRAIDAVWKISQKK